MLKETFKMRKIGKHLVNVSMLSLAVAPIVVSGIQPVFAEERVANAQSEYPTKIENDMTPSNTPDAKGTYNSQIKSIELVSQSGNAYRYKVTLHDGYSIPKGGKLRINTNISYENISLDAFNVLDSNGSVIGELNTIGNSRDGYNEVLREFMDAKTVSKHSALWKSLNINNYSESRDILFTANDLFAETNTGRSFEFVINTKRLYTFGRGTKGVQLEYGVRPESMASLYPDHTFKTGVGINDKYVKSTDVLVDIATSKINSVELSPAQYGFGAASSYGNFSTDTNRPQWINPTFGLSNSSILNLESHGLSAVQEGSEKKLYLKKGDVIRYQLPDSISLKYNAGVEVGNTLSLDVVEQTSSAPVEKGDRFTDTTDYKVFERGSVNKETRTVPFKLTKLEGSVIEGVVGEDVYVNPKKQLSIAFPLNNYKSASGIIESFSLNKSITDILDKDDLDEFTKQSSADFDKLYKNTGVSIMRDGSVVSKSQDMRLSFRKNRNIAVGDQTIGTVKVKYVDETGVEIPNNPIETIAENKPWYESVTITPKEIKGYKFVRADKSLKLAVGTGENIVTLTYAKEITYIPDPRYDAGTKVPDPDDPSRIYVGTKPKVVEEDIPFKEEVRENPKLPKGTENVIQEGEKGKKTTTTTYTLDDKTGKVTSTEKVTTKDPKNRIIERGTGDDKDGDLIVNYIPDPENEPGKQTIVDEGKKPKLDVTGKVKDPGKPKVIKVGTKPKVVEEDIPFKEEVRENPKLPKGTEFVIQEGEKGKKKTTTTYTLDPKTGKVTSEDKVETKDPKNRIIEQGTGEDVDGEIVVTYIPDPENEPGKQTIVDEGSKPKLDVTGKVKDPGKPKVIKVGMKPKVVEEDIPFKEEVRENPKLPKGTEFVIQEGEKGKKKTTTTYTLDPKTGKVTSEDKVETKDPKNRIIEQGTGEDVDGDLIVKYIPDPEEEPGKQTVVDEGKKPKFDVTGKELDPGSPKVIKVGTKPKVVEEDIPFKEEIRENPELPEGERKVVQEGQAGKKTTTTTYTLDEKTGKVNESTTEKVDEPKVQIVEVGTKKSETPKEEPKVETPTTEAPKTEQPKTTEAPKVEQPKTTEEPKAKETPKQLPKTSEQAKQRNTVIIALLSVVGLGGLVTYFGLRKRDEK